ncbi:MAG: hypothetical protein AAF327_00455 [Cyanobacteria bacterium P01_A01_bin.37]
MEEIINVCLSLLELQADLPNLENREDWEAEIMRQATVPQIVLNILQENLESTQEDAIANMNPDVS